MRSKHIIKYILVALIFSGVFLIKPNVLANTVRTIHLNDESIAIIRVSLRGTVLSFPVKPTKVILGRSGSFGLEYVENDLAISPLSATARSNLFVYLFGRRFSFDLTASPGEGSAVILVRDAYEQVNKKSGKAR